MEPEDLSNNSLARNIEKDLTRKIELIREHNNKKTAERKALKEKLDSVQFATMTHHSWCPKCETTWTLPDPTFCECDKCHRIVDIVLGPNPVAAPPGPLETSEDCTTKPYGTDREMTS